MTQSIKTFAAAIFLSLGISTLSFAQITYANNSVKNSPTGISISEEEPNNTVTTTVVSPVMEAKFFDLFPNATQQKWAITSENSFVSFLNNGSKATASFNAKGKLSYVITACNMDQLPRAFSKAIKNNYADYRLFHATEITAYGETAYQAIIENATRFITLKYTADGVEEIKQVKK